MMYHTVGIFPNLREADPHPIITGSICKICIIIELKHPRLLKYIAIIPMKISDKVKMFEEVLSYF